jgi:hypothetical protein
MEVYRLNSAGINKPGGGCKGRQPIKFPFKPGFQVSGVVVDFPISWSQRPFQGRSELSSLTFVHLVHPLLIFNVITGCGLQAEQGSHFSIGSLALIAALRCARLP